MNMKKRIFAILLSAAMMFTLMPLAAFADEAPVEPTGVKWESPDLHGVVGTTQLGDFTPGLNKVTVHYSDGSDRKFT